MVRFPRNEELVGYVARRLRELRLECGLSQEKVLFETGIRVEHIELGRNNITISTLQALCTLYGTSLHEFFAPDSIDAPEPSGAPEPTDTPESTDAPASTEVPEPTHTPEFPDNHEQETHPQ